jgi:hypothetical protein
MPQFIYYLPGVDRASATPEQLAAFGLGYAFEHPVCAGVTRGPSDSKDEPGPPGVVVSESREGVPPRYLPDKQTWRRLPGEAWVGMFSNGPPTPKDLAREEQLSGYLLHLADGRPWHVPCARRWHPSQDDDNPTCVVALPKGLAYLDGRWVTGHVVERYRPLWGLVESYCEAMRQACEAAGDEIKTNILFQFDQLDLLAVGALQLNYRVADIELAMLGAYDEKSRQAIVDAVLDNPGFEALTVKKKLLSLTGRAAGNG